MSWKIKAFNELTAEELYRIYYLRTKIFVVGQKRIYQEVDEVDPKAVHVFYDKNDKITAYARVYLIDGGKKVSFGRFVTVPEERGKGLGADLLEHVRAMIQDRFPGKPIEIKAQQQVAGFYAKYGFKQQGDPFIFESTPHVLMTHPALGEL